MTDRSKFEILLSDLDAVRVTQKEQVEAVTEARVDQAWPIHMATPAGGGPSDADGD